jgi:hypothetical protein
MIQSFSNSFSWAERFWHHPRTTSWISNLLIAGFLSGLLIATLSHFEWVDWEVSFFVSIDISFTILLFVEILGLIFILPQSVADSVGKQFEIFSIILLRSAFKEFGATNGDISFASFSEVESFFMYYDAFGALLIFGIIGIYYKIQRHEPITDSDEEQLQFIHFKQVLAFGMLMVFLVIGVIDLYELVSNGTFYPSIHVFYMFLIFTDVLILLYSLRYASRYFNIFRYSSFAFATILIRLALSSEPGINVILGLIAGLFVLGLSIAYNYFMKHRII